MSSIGNDTMALFSGLLQDEFASNEGLLTPSDMFFAHQELFGAQHYSNSNEYDLEQNLMDQASLEQAIMAGLEINVEEATPQLSPCEFNGRMAPNFIKVPMMDFGNFDMAFSHSPLGSPLDELQQNILMFNSATNSPTYPENFYGGRRASTPACFTDLMAMLPSFTQGSVPPPKSANSTPPKSMSRRASSSATTRSRRNSNASTSKPDSPTKIYTCTEPGCNKIFKRSEHLKRHLKSIHCEEKPFSCPFPKCDKKFSRSDNLAQHLRIHRDPSDKARTKGFTSSTPFVLSAASDLDEQMAYPNPL